MVRASPTWPDADDTPAGGQGGPNAFAVKYAERGNPVSPPEAIRVGSGNSAGEIPEILAGVFDTPA